MPFNPQQVTLMRRSVRADQQRKRQAALLEPVLDEDLAELAELVRLEPEVLSELGGDDELRAALSRAL